jgi:predicted DCC family thiol-disulfide oxidoreductase YuxK
MTDSTNTPQLPSPAERPNADVVIFDGNCRICTAQINKLPWWDCQKHLAYLSLHDPDVARRYPDLTYDMMMRDMYIVDQKGRRHRGAAAIRYLSRRLRRLWWLAPVLHIPFSLPLWQWLYRQIADRRYRWGKLDECEDGACSLHARPQSTARR